jgi:phosphoglycerate dehydrogenase-like enzyme
VGLIGFGAIGRLVAKRLQGFDCKVWAFDPAVSAETADRLGVTLKPLTDLLPQVDFLSLHCPLLPETRAMVDSAFLSHMKPTAYLVNTARGEVIDEAALVEALDRGQIRGVALDVFVRQPPPPDHPLLRHPKVIATPHMSAHTDGARDSMARGAFQNCLAVLRGEASPNRVI